MWINSELAIRRLVPCVKNEDTERFVKFESTTSDCTHKENTLSVGSSATHYRQYQDCKKNIQLAASILKKEPHGLAPFMTLVS